jgi:hypothetical protein
VRVIFEILLEDFIKEQPAGSPLEFRQVLFNKVFYLVHAGAKTKNRSPQRDPVNKLKHRHAFRP